MSDVLTIGQINADGTATTKEEAIEEAADILVAAGAVTRRLPRGHARA